MTVFTTITNHNIHVYIYAGSQYSRDPNKSDALYKSDGWKNRQKSNKSDAYNKSDAWKTKSLPVKMCFMRNYRIKYKILVYTQKTNKLDSQTCIKKCVRTNVFIEQK